MSNKTIRLLYHDFVSGGLDEYYFGANLMAHILPQNDNQPLYRVPIEGPDGRTFAEDNGINGRAEVAYGIEKAQEILAESQPDRVITIGGNCLVSLAPFDYLNGKHSNLGILWIDAHPDVSTPADGYPQAHAMVLGSLLGAGDSQLSAMMKNAKFKPQQVMYVGLQGIHSYQQGFLDKAGVEYKVQTESFVTDEEIKAFLSRYDNILVHLDIDVLDEHFFHSTYYANPEAGGDGAGGGRMHIEQLSSILQMVEQQKPVVGFTIAEYLPFDEYKLHKMFGSLKLFSE